MANRPYSVPEYDDDLKQDQAMQMIYKDVVADTKGHLQVLEEYIEQHHEELSIALDYVKKFNGAKYRECLFSILTIIKKTEFEEHIIEPLFQKRMEGK